MRGLILQIWKAGEYGRRGKTGKAKMISEFSVFPSNVRSYTMESHQQDSVNMGGTRTTVDMPKRTGERPQGLNPTQRSIGMMLRAREIVFPR